MLESEPVLVLSCSVAYFKMLDICQFYNKIKELLLKVKKMSKFGLRRKKLDAFYLKIG